MLKLLQLLRKNSFSLNLCALGKSESLNEFHLETSKSQKRALLKIRSFSTCLFSTFEIAFNLDLDPLENESLNEFHRKSALS